MATFRLSLGKHLFCRDTEEDGKDPVSSGSACGPELGCLFTSSYSPPGLGFGDGEGAELCVFPSSLFLAGISHPAGAQALELSAPSWRCCQFQVTSSTQ